MPGEIPHAAGGGSLLVKPASWEALRKKVEEIELLPDPKDFHVTTRGGRKLLRLRGPGEAFRPGPPLVPAFSLSAGKDGARIFKGVLEWAITTLRFDRKSVLMSEGGSELLNVLTGQDPIVGVQVMPRGGESSGEPESSTDDDDGWWQLPWWGEVWAKVVLDPDSGEPVSWDIVGPEKPEMRAIPALDAELTRDSSDDSAGEYGYTIRIGEVPEDGAITQDRTGNLEWFVAFIPENGASSESEPGSSDATASGSSSSSGGSGDLSDSSASSGGSSGASSSGSSKDTAVVPTPWGYRKWYAMEAAEVMFFDFPELEVPRGRSSYAIDPIVLFCLEPGSARAFISPERGSATVRVKDGEIHVLARHWPWPRKQTAQVMLYGVRRDFAGVRNGEADFEDFVDNECRLNPRMTRAEVLQALAERGVTS